MRFIMTCKIQKIAGEGADKYLDLFVSGQSQTLPEGLPYEHYLRGGCRSMPEEPVSRPFPEFAHVALTAIMPSLHGNRLVNKNCFL